MGMNKSYLSYADCKDALERALKSKKGIRLTYKTKSEAFRFVARSCAFRVLDRKESEKLYDQFHTMYGRSAYDVLKICRPAANIVEIIPVALDESIITELE